MTMLRWRVMPFLLFLGTVFAAGADPLDELNAAFRQAYAAARTTAFETQGPVLVVSGDSLILYRDQAVVAEAELRPAQYHHLKAMAHVPLALRLTLRALGGGPLGPEARARVARLREGLVAAGLRGAIPEGALKVLDGVLARNQVALKELDEYCRAMAAPLEATLRAAAALELEALAKLVPAWRRTYLAADWDRVAVVVIGSHMAREGEVSWQFFTRLFGEAREGGRLVFAEGLWNPRDALALLATHRVDRDLGEAFFGDPWRMHRDVMAGAAKIWLDSHPPAP
jgi:hypothetical protein